MPPAIARSSPPPVNTNWPFLALTISVPVSWHIGNTPPGGSGVFAAHTSSVVDLGTGILDFEAIVCDANLSPVVDGAVTAVEDANRESFTASISGGDAPATVYWTNDCENMYLAVTVQADDGEPFSALVFKTAHEPHVGGRAQVERGAGEHRHPARGQLHVVDRTRVRSAGIQVRLHAVSYARRRAGRSGTAAGRSAALGLLARVGGGADLS